MRFSTLNAVRRQRVYLNKWLALDFTTPFEVDDDGLETALVELKKLMDDYRTILSTRERQPQKHQYGQFRTETIISASQDPRSVPQLMDIVEGYMMKALQQERVDALHQDAFEIADDEPTQGVMIESFWEFSMTGANDHGSIELTMDHPTSWSGERKPIEDIKSFLSSVWTRYAGEWCRLVGDLREIHQEHAKDSPGQAVPECLRSRELPLLYRPTGAGYKFSEAAVMLIPNEGLLPDDSAVGDFLDHFLERVAYRAPQLCR